MNANLQGHQSKVADPLDSFVEPNFIDLLCGLDHCAVIDFFFYFSRFEHALKIKRFICTDKSAQYVVGVDWHAFIRTLPNNYPSGSEKVDNAIRYICNYPVKRQKTDLTWVARSAITPPCFKMALNEVPKIRNNIFHGGKYLRPNKVRDEALLINSTILIKTCLQNDPDLYQQFIYTGK